jgi:hypothetical protein
VNDLDDRLDDLRRLASVTAILDREGALRLYAVIFALEVLSAKLDAIEPLFGIEPSGSRAERRLDA